MELFDLTTSDFLTAVTGTVALDRDLDLLRVLVLEVDRLFFEGDGVFLDGDGERFGRPGDFFVLAGDLLTARVRDLDRDRVGVFVCAGDLGGDTV